MPTPAPVFCFTDKLTHDQKLMVKVAACIGSKFKPEMLRDIMNTVNTATNQNPLSMREVEANLKYDGKANQHVSYLDSLSTEQYEMTEILHPGFSIHKRTKGPRYCTR
jgi:hypothetical protein